MIQGDLTEATYDARRGSPGRATAEPASLQHMRSGTVMAWSEAAAVRMK